MRHLDPAIQTEILKQSYISAQDIYHLYPLGRNESNKLFNQIVSELMEEGIPLLPCRPRAIPISRVLKKYPIRRSKK